MIKLCISIIISFRTHPHHKRAYNAGVVVQQQGCSTNVCPFYQAVTQPECSFSCLFRRIEWQSTHNDSPQDDRNLRDAHHPRYAITPSAITSSPLQFTLSPPSPGCYDALSAKILQQAGHRAAYVSGAAVTATQLGEPDLGLLTASEMARNTSQICASVPADFPVLADADTGGGSILNVQRTIRSLILAGASGCILEDQKWPKRIGYSRNKEVLNREEFVAKILAAREAIGDADFFLICRTDARSTSAKYGLEDAIARVNLYIDAGADAQLVGGVRSVEELGIVAKQSKGLRVANMVEGGVTPLCTSTQLREMGFDIAIFPLSAIFTATRALTEVYTALAEDGTTQRAWENMVSWRAFNDILGIEDRLSVDEHFTKVKGPASNIGQQLRVKVKGLVKPVSVGGGGQ